MLPAFSAPLRSMEKSENGALEGGYKTTVYGLNVDLTKILC